MERGILSMSCQPIIHEINLIMPGVYKIMVLNVD